MIQTRVSPALSPSAAWIFVCLGSYYLLQAAARILAGGALQLDEAEQVLYSQEWHWGYGSQGPLYTWLVLILRTLCPSDIVALATLKNALLFGIHVAVYRIARSIFASRAHAIAACVSPLLIPHFVYESQRDQTHLVLATACTAATIAQMLRVAARPTRLNYVWLGAFSALGLLSKYNVAVLFAGLAAAALSVPETRRAILHPYVLWALLSLTILAAPHIAWMLENPAILFSQSHKLGTRANADPLSARLNALLRLLFNIGTYLCVPVLLWLILKPVRSPQTLPSPVPRARSASPFAVHLLFRTWMLTLLVAAAATALFAITQIKARWFQPAMILLPIWFIYHLRHHLSPHGQRRILRAAFVIALLASITLHGTVWAARFLNRPHNINVPFDAIAEQLVAENFQQGLILSTDLRLAGNLLRHFEGSSARVPNISFFTTSSNIPTLLVWDAAHGPEIPAALRSFADPWIGDWPCHQPSGIAEAPGRRQDPRTSRFYFLLVPPEDVVCPAAAIQNQAR